MAIWVDEHAYSNNCDENTLYEYLYHLSNMLAHQSAYFSKADDYDQFALFSASRLFLRLNNPKQFEYDADGHPCMEQIKSILNYAKKVMYPYKVDFESEFNLVNKDIQVISAGNFDLGSHLMESTSLFDQLHFSFVFSDIVGIVRAHLSKIPYKKNSSEWMNIYLSCMLTLLDSITLSKKDIERYELSKRDQVKLLEKIYTDLRYAKPILYHLDESMQNYITVLVNELRHVIASELSWKSDYYISPEDSMKNLLVEIFTSEND